MKTVMNLGPEVRQLRWTPFFGQDCGKLSYDVHGWEW